MDVEIRIHMSNGQLTVNAPFEQKALCYGMLEIAKDVIRERAEALQKAVLPASQSDIIAMAGQRQ